MFYSQVAAMECVVQILKDNPNLRNEYGAVISDVYRNNLIEILNHMIEIRTKPLTKEQRERKNECARIRRANKRKTRDIEIWNRIHPFLNGEEHTAAELASLVNDGKRWDERISSDEIISFFKRNKIPEIECAAPRTAWTFKMKA